jgi:hypothetical protein
LLVIKTDHSPPSNVSTSSLTSRRAQGQFDFYTSVLLFHIIAPPTKFIKFLFVFRFSKRNYAFFILYMQDTCPEHLSPYNLITLIFDGKRKF